MALFGKKEEVKEKPEEQTYNLTLAMKVADDSSFGHLSLEEANEIMNQVKNTKEGFVYFEIKENDRRYHSSCLFKIEELAYIEIVQEDDEEEDDEDEEGDD